MEPELREFIDETSRVERKKMKREIRKEKLLRISKWASKWIPRIFIGTAIAVLITVPGFFIAIIAIAGLLLIMCFIYHVSHLVLIRGFK